MATKLFRTICMVMFTMNVTLFSVGADVGTTVNSEFWENYFSSGEGGSVHELSSDGDILSNPMGAVVTRSYPSSFSATSEQYSAIISTLGYQKIAAFYKGRKSAFTVSTLVCAATIFVGELVPECVERVDNSTATDLDFRFNSGSTYNTDVNVELTVLAFNPQAPINLTPHKIYFQLFNEMQSSQSILPISEMEKALYLPTIVSSSFDFPTNTTAADNAPTTLAVRVNGAMYDTLTIKLLMYDVGGATCDQVYMEILGEKICDNITLVTLNITGPSHRTLNLTYTNTIAYQGVGMLVKITGSDPGERYTDICAMTNSNIEESSDGSLISITTPNWPFDNGHSIKDCHVKFTGFDSVFISVNKYTTDEGSRNCSRAKLEVISNTNVNDSFTVCFGDGTTPYTEITGTSLTVRYSQTANISTLPFEVLAYPKRFRDICGSDVKNKQLTKLPLHLKSSGFPSPYQPGAQCGTYINISDLTHVEVHFESFDLEESDLCGHDFLRIGTKQYCKGTNQGKTIVIQPANGIPIMFRTDPSMNGKGFAITITRNYSAMLQSPLPLTLPPHTQTTTMIPTPTPDSATTPKTPDSASTHKIPDGSEKPKVTIPSGAGKGKRKQDSSSLPSYVWAIVALVIAGVGAAAIAGVLVMRRRRRKLMRLDENDVDVGFENPVYGHRQSERITFSSDF